MVITLLGGAGGNFLRKGWSENAEKENLKSNHGEHGVYAGKTVF
jgi:hypothetical protein